RPLHHVACSLAVRAAGPAVGGLLEAPALPPLGVAARQMTGGLEGAGDCLAHTIGSHEQPLFVLCASGEELEVLRLELATEGTRIRKQCHERGSSALPFGLNQSAVEHQSKLPGITRTHAHCFPLPGWALSIKAFSRSSSSSESRERSGRASIGMGAPPGPLCSLLSTSR